MEFLQGCLYLFLLQATVSAAFPYLNASQPLSYRDILINGNQYHPQAPARDPTCNHSDYEKIDCPAPSICYHQRGGAPACCPPDTNCDPPWIRDPLGPALGPSPSQPGAPAAQSPADSTSQSNQANGSGNAGVGVSGSSRAENHNSNNFNVSVKNIGTSVLKKSLGGLWSVPFLAVTVLAIL
ncbi:uncharacterized protein MCYG_04328 [Microsporum canis CBS 113480]|uniref:Uncharacterized protein n=1 Tax=Arthroderma otae (strain ATCC MYA-4605 / CBS 113480) TaxID=554155 RepID=C5FPJ3_ARTOC|nr:uncharacterized protein MCYG_04328 [Microsporum canis CBS 113480]EEQ31509.1 predicted protein [Microsporum canis CBS 113480]